MNVHLHLQRFVTVIGLGVSLVSATGEAVAQETVAPTINADGRSGTSNAGLNPAVDADGPTLIYGDIDSGPGTTVIGPPAAAPVASDMVAAPPPGTSGDITATDGNAAALGPGDASAAPGTVTGGTGTALLGPDGTYSVSEVSPSNVTVGTSGAPAPAPVAEPVAEPVYEPAPEAAVEPVTTSEPVAADPGVTDSDGDGVADQDEVNIYGTDPWVWDTDGDGLSDGEELFAAGTDPLVPDTNADGVADGGDASPASTDMVVADEATTNASGTDSDNDRLPDADEAAVGTDPTAPDADGDGYYDGDEVNLGTDPLDPASFPTDQQPPVEESASPAT
jgi:hypothetical protein